MVNEITQHIPPKPLALIQGGLPMVNDLFIADRSRIMIMTVSPDRRVKTACHIHASKQITVLDGYAEIELPDHCIKLYEGQSTHISNGIAHKIVNLGKIPLKYVEIRTGPYVKDDDQLNELNISVNQNIR